jgi:hypothetical protein
LGSTAIFEILRPFAPRLRKSEIDASGHIPGLFNNGFHVVHEGRLQELWLTIITNKRRRPVEFKDGCRYGKFGKTKAYELIAQGSGLTRP